jgi:hypothetical protein
MGERIREAGLRAAKQVGTNTNESTGFPFRLD